MKLWEKLLGLALAEMPDVASGVLAAHVVFGYAPIWQAHTWIEAKHQLTAYILGSIIAVLPDFDFLFAKKPERLEELSGEHRTIAHHPVLTIPALAIVLGTFSWEWAVIAILAMAAHYVDDSFDEKGVQWHYPIYPNHFEFLRDGQLLKIRTPKDVQKNPPPQLQEWLEQSFLRICWRSVGYTLYTLAAIITVLALKGG